jgi:sugar lactone lactonase YvrE
MTKIFSVIAICLSLFVIPRASHAAGIEIVATGLGFPEGTIFVGSTLYFVDYSTSDVLRLTGNKVETVWHQAGCGANGLIQVPDGLLAACYNSNTLAEISLGGRLLRTISKDKSGGTFQSPNDLAADAKGGVYFTGSGNEDVLGKVYYLAANHVVTKVASGISDANGLVVSPDGKILYVASTTTGLIFAYTIAPDGTLSDQRPFVDLARILAPGRGHYGPDGVRIDKNGNLFVGLYDGGGFAVISPDGKLIKQINLPGAHHSNLAITPNGKSIYITSADDAFDGSFVGELYLVANPVPE